jgi:RNA polymerase sigma factor (sigma-70 family)
LIMDTMGMVDTLAYKLLATYRFPIDRDDLKSVGYVALVEAASSYDGRHGVSFVGWAFCSVRGAMLNAIRDGHGAVTRSEKVFVDRQGGSPSVTFHADWAMPPGASDHLEPEHRVEVVRAHARLRALIEALPTAQRTIVDLYFLLGSFEPVAKKLNLSRAWVFRIYAKAVGRILQLWPTDSVQGTDGPRPSAVSGPARASCRGRRASSRGSSRRGSSRGSWPPGRLRS